ncbi:MAG: response regulator transcription factor [Pseudomonadales bacterium]|nr:response regulator transcription factor [Pseudomonadales bacterium]
MKTAIVADDEPNLARHLCEQLATVAPEIEVLAVANNGFDALAVIARYAPDVAFLDIRMPGLDGLAVARSVPDRTRVVFVTAFDDYAVEAFAAAAVDYLLKPVSAERLRACVARLDAAGPSERSIRELLERLGARAADHLRWLKVGQGDTTRLVAVDDVLYFRSDSKYTVAVTETRESVLRTPLKELERELDPAFFWRVNRGLIVNVRWVVEARRDLRGRYRLVLRGRPEVLRTSEAYGHRFRQM